MSEKKDLLMKLKILSEKGIGGEKINAQIKLKQYMNKYGYTEADIEGKDTRDYYFNYKSSLEKDLLCQTIYKVTNSTEMFLVYTGTRKKIKIKVNCTLAEKIEIDFLFDFYKRLFKKDYEVFLEAFIQKNKIFGNLNDSEELPIDDKKLAQIYAMIKGLSSEYPTRQIESINE